MIIVGGIIKNSDNKYLLIKERKEKYYGMYNIPAGHLEENELLIDGAKREIKEETGYTVDVKGIVQVGDTEKFTSFIFYCEIISEQESYNSDEILSVEWLSLDEINNIADQLRSPELILDAIKRVEDKKVYSLDIIK
ncbi:MAG: NUDIX hydrolase [Bacilli bacterium]|nr:NUDIX hydrolase [Bacilli bacterium]MBR3209828.1 NUDIX hydrolase [Bacilli bacterium]